MIEIIKLYIVTLLLKFITLVRSFIKSGKVEKYYKKCYMYLLYRTDHPYWRVLKAKEVGVRVGENCRLFSLNISSEPYLVEIGDNVIISGEVQLITHDGSVLLFHKEIPNLFGSFGKIKIGNNCFIGMGAIILPNVEIGDNCIVCAGAVVMSSFPDESVIAGNPAKVIFKTNMLKKMKMHNKLTFRHEDYPYPYERNIPEDEKRLFLLNQFNALATGKDKKKTI